MAGNALEFYNFAVYVLFIPVIGPLFFPSEDPAVSAMGSIMVYSVGYLSRPFGGLLFGHIGDRYGRRKALMLSVSFMAVPALVIACLPTYGTIGFMGPVILTICRLFQGFSLGGEYHGASIFVIEHGERSRGGFAGSVILASCYMGVLLATIVATTFNKFWFPEWSWRIPFLVGFLNGFMVLYIRYRMTETPRFLDYIKKERPKSIPILAIFKANRKSLMCGVFVACASGVMGSTMGYMSTFLVIFKGWDVFHAVMVVGLGCLVYIGLPPIIGRLSDRLGARRVMLCGLTCVFLFSFPVFYMFSTGIPLWVCLGQVLWCCGTSVFEAPLNNFLNQLFPVWSRYSSIGVTYSIGIVIFAGLNPLILTYTAQSSSYVESSVVWISFPLFLGFLGTYFSKGLNGNR